MNTPNLQSFFVHLFVKRTGTKVVVKIHPYSDPDDDKKRPSFQEIVALLHENTEKYIFPGADLAAVKEYESRIISTISQGK